MNHHALKSRIQRSFRSSLLILGVLANLGMSTPYNRTDGNLWQEKNSSMVSQRSGYGIDAYKPSQLFTEIPTLVTRFVFLERVTLLGLDSHSLLSNHPYALQDDPPPPVECYSLATGSNPAQGGDVLVSPGPDCGIDQYTPGTEITLTAMPEADYTFSGWSGNASGFDNPLVFIISGNYSMTADFELTQIPQECYSLHITNAGGGTVSSDPAPNCNGTQYLAGTTVTLTGYPDTEHFLSGWVDRGYANPLQVVMTSDQYVQPMFTPSCYSIATIVTPSGSGSVTITPPPNCSDGVRWTYGTYVSFTETPAEHYDFDYWSTPFGDLHGGLGFTLFEDVSIAANFSRSCYSVIGIVQPAGTGDITISPEPNCPSGGVNKYISGTSVTASANATLNYGFIGWSDGEWSDATNPATRIVSSDMFFLANFEHCRELTYTINPPGTGTVLSSPQPNCNNGYEYNPRSTVEMTAVPAEGYAFSYWSGYAEGENHTIQIEMWEDQSVTANFKPLCYTLDYSINPSDASSIDVNPEPNCDDGTGTIGYTPGTEVALHTYPSIGYDFLGWNGDAAGSSYATTLTMSGNKSVVADFQSLCFSLTSETIPENGGSVSISPPPNCNNGTQYQFGTYVQIAAIPEPGFTFIEWSGYASGSENPLDYLVGESEQDLVIVANFHEGNCYSLTTRTTPSSVSPGAITIDPPPDCGSMYSEGTQVSLTASPGGSIYGWFLAFSYWSGSVSSTAYSINVTMDGDQDITANYYLGTAPCRNLSIAVNPLGAGSVTADPSPNCNGGTQYVPNTLVELTAEPAEEYIFSRWGGSVSGTINPEFVAMNGDKNIVAYYSLGSLSCVSLSTIVTPEGSGAVTVEPAPNCSGGTQYIPGTQVILSAAPVQGYAFDSWSGDLSDTTNPKILVLTVNTTVTANFLATPCYTVSVDVNPPGSGSFNVSPSPNCGGTGYAWNTGIVITPDASSGYQFTNWNIGDLVFDEGLLFPQLFFMMSDNVHVTANFEPISTCYSLTTSQFPDDGGSVSVSPPPNCSNGTQYVAGTRVELTAVPSEGYSLIGWSEDDTDINPLTITMDGNREIFAYFDSSCYTLLTSINPIEGGRIEVSPPPNCNEGTQYIAGTHVAITASASPGSTFLNWSGDVSGFGNSLSFQMLGEMSVSAWFFQGSCFSLSTTVDPPGAGQIVTSPSPNCNGGTQFVPGTEVVLHATTNQGYGFGEWTGDITSIENPIRFTLNSDITAIANYVNMDCYTVSVDVNPPGSGSFNVSPSPNCGGTGYAWNAAIIITPDASSGYQFVNWNIGDLVFDEGLLFPQLFFMISDNVHVTANFEPISTCYSLTTSQFPDDGGSVSVSPPPNCSNGTQYVAGTQVSIMAIPEPGFSFIGWSEFASGSENPLEYVVEATEEDQVVIANFHEGMCYSLTTQTTPSSLGLDAITIEPPPNCGSLYLEGTQVSLTAMPGGSIYGWFLAFSYWSGSASGTGNPLVVTMDENKNITANYYLGQSPCRTLTLDVNPTDSGSIFTSPAPNCNGGTQYTPDTYVSLTAQPAAGFILSHWSGGTGSSDLMTSVNMAVDHNITANFVQGTCYSLTSSTIGDGTIAFDPAPNCNGNTQYLPGTTVQLFARPMDAETGRFFEWGGDIHGVINPISITMDRSTSVTANFESGSCHTLTTSVVGNGTITTDPPPDCNNGTQYSFESTVVVTAFPVINNLFSSWSGSIIDTHNPMVFNIVEDTDLTATFTENPCYTLVVSIDPSDAGFVMADPAPNCNNGTQYLPGTSVNLTATPYPAHSFAGWGGELSGADNPAEILMNNDLSVEAVFSSIQCYSLTLHNHDTLGVSDAQPFGGQVDPPPNCGEQYIEGTQVALTPLPDGSLYGWFYSFTYWSGSTSGTGSPKVVTMDGDKDITANYYMGQYPCVSLETIILPGGTGAITVEPAPNCSSGTKYIPGTQVTVSAVPIQGYALDSWGRDLTGNTNPEILTMASDTTIIANFIHDELCFTLDTLVFGNGLIDITPAPNCNGGSEYFAGTIVKLFATAAPGWSFVYWGDDATGTFPIYSLQMNSNKSVRAMFGLLPGIPKLLLPENKDNLKSHTVTLDWADPIPLADHYVLQISKHNDFNDIVFTAEDIVKSEYTFIVPEGNVRYYWRVQAVNAFGQTSDWSVSFSFKTHKKEKEPT